MDAHWYVLGQGVFKSWVLQPSIIKQAHIASTALLGTPLTVDRDHDRWSCELLLSGSSQRGMPSFWASQWLQNYAYPSSTQILDLTHPTPLHGAKAHFGAHVESLLCAHFIFPDVNNTNDRS